MLTSAWNIIETYMYPRRVFFYIIGSSITLNITPISLVFMITHTTCGKNIFKCNINHTEYLVYGMTIQDIESTCSTCTFSF